MKRSLTIFVCSTYTDLVEERAAVLDAIRKLQHTHDSMEFFGARANIPIETCIDEVRKSDLLIVIIGHRYGSLIPKRKVSFSEAEYNEGYRLDKPCLVYLRDENVPVLIKHTETDPRKIKLLNNFKATVRNRHTTATFKAAHDLSLQVAADISQTAQAIEDEAARRESETPLDKNSVLNDGIGKLIRDAVDSGLPEASVIAAVKRAIISLQTTHNRHAPRVFLCYSHADKAIVEAFANGLRDANIEVWFDAYEVTYGDNLMNKISAAINYAEYLAFFISTQSLSSVWAQQEINLMMTRRLEGGSSVIIPILLDKVTVPAIIKDVVYIDMTDKNVTNGVKSFVTAVRKHGISRAPGQS